MVMLMMKTALCEVTITVW